MFAKIAVLFAVVAIAYGGVIGHLPASTQLLANTVIAAPAHTIIHAPSVAAVRTVAVAQPQVLAQPIQTIVAQPQVIQTGTKIIQTVEPVEQHGYRIAY